LATPERKDPPRNATIARGPARRGNLRTFSVPETGFFRNLPAYSMLAEGARYDGGPALPTSARRRRRNLRWTAFAVRLRARS